MSSLRMVRNAKHSVTAAGTSQPNSTSRITDTTARTHNMRKSFIPQSHRLVALDLQFLRDHILYKFRLVLRRLIIKLFATFIAVNITQDTDRIFIRIKKHGHVQPCTLLRIDIQMKLSIDVEPCFHIRDDNLLPLVIHFQIVNAQILCFQFVVAFHSFLLICLPSRPFSKD